MEKEIKIAAKLYNCRDTAKRFFADKYEEKLIPYKNAIKKHQETFKLDVLESVLEISNFESLRDNGMATMLLMAAAVELIELKNCNNDTEI